MEQTGNLVFGFLLSWAFGLLPPAFVRYALLERPISKVAAGAACFVYFLVMFAVVAAVGGRPNATFLIALVSYFILIRPSTDTVDDPAFEAASRREIGRPPIDGFESHIGRSAANKGNAHSESRSHTTHDETNGSKPSRGQSERDKGVRGWISDLSSFERTVFLILLGFVLLTLFYYIASPYQNCIRQKHSESFCLRNTGW